MLERAVGTSASELSRDTITTIYRLHHSGVSGLAIAEQLGCARETVAYYISQLVDTRDVAKLYLNGQALGLARDVVAEGKPADKVAVLKGLAVLGEDQASGMTIVQIGAGAGDVQVAVQVVQP